MANVAPRTIDLLVDGKKIEVKTSDPLSEKLSDALNDPIQFKSFAENPAVFAQSFGLSIDKDISDLLKQSIGNAASLNDLQQGGGNAQPTATLWAVAVGTYSIASSKIAVAALEQ